MSVVTRFAPSPTGDLHLGHAFAACFARDVASKVGGRFLIRIEDIDATRCRAEFIRRNLDDLAWLGLRWEEPVLHQSRRLDVYRCALERLRALGVIYPCFCTRARIRAEIEAASAAPQERSRQWTSGPEAVRYPGICRTLPAAERQDRLASGQPFALRLDSGRALDLTGALFWSDRIRGRLRVDAEAVDEVVLARREIPTSYHLSVVVDDAAQGVTEVTRGEDLLAATPVHCLLYALLELPAPRWHHHPLCRDADGRRLAKRDHAISLRALRDRGLGPDEVMAMAVAAAAQPTAGAGHAATVPAQSPG